MASIYEFGANTVDGLFVPLSSFTGSVLLIVNTASMCGFTYSNMPQLVELQRHFGESDVKVLLFPCSQFANQEPKSGCEVRDWAASSFPGAMEAFHPWWEKVHVKGPNAHPLFVSLQKSLGPIRWNFTKFVCNREGVPVKRFDSAQCGSEVYDFIAQLISSN